MKTLVICIALFVAGINSSVAQVKKGLLWEISGKGMTKPAYLFGTVHGYDSSLYQFPEAPFEILDKVDKLYLELDFGKIDPAEMMSSLYIKDTTQYIDKLLDVASLEKLNAAAASSDMLKMMGNKLYAIKPMVLMSMILSNNSKVVSLDMELYKTAADKGKPVGGLETWKEQQDVMDMVTIPAQIDMLKEALLKEASISKLTATYVKQEISKVAAEMSEDMPLDANFNDALVTKRNIVMANRIDSILHTEHPLIAVGCGHLGNNRGLVDLLKKKGYTLKSIPFVIKKAHE